MVVAAQHITFDACAGTSSYHCYDKVQSSACTPTSTQPKVIMINVTVGKSYEMLKCISFLDQTCFIAHPDLFHCWLAFVFIPTQPYFIPCLASNFIAYPTLFHCCMAFNFIIYHSLPRMIFFGFHSSPGLFHFLPRAIFLRFHSS